MAGRPCIFIDRDKVLNKDTGYIYKVADLELLDGVAQGLAALKSAGFLVVVVSNQSGVGRGFFTDNDVINFNAALNERIQQSSGANIDGFYYCPHTPEQSCRCRKPSPFLIESAAADHNIDLSKSWMIGDRESDMVCGRNAGLPTIQIIAEGEPCSPSADHVATNLPDAADIIIQNFSS